MHRKQTIWLLVLASLLISGGALAQNPTVNFTWTPSPIESPDGDALSPAVAYQVWLTVGAEDPIMIDTVKGTQYELEVEPGLVHHLGVRGVAELGGLSPMSEWSDPVYFELGTRAVPPVAALGAIYPNPFNPETRIAYGIPNDLAAGTPIRLEIFNLSGQRIRTMETENTPGLHEVIWNGTDDSGQPASSGMYVTRFVVGAMVETKKMTMLK